EEYLKAWTF
nr:Chain C, EEYLKAWTF, mimotope peptide [synthetic construct]3KPO_C Chain C, EEYLKAWTF, mimotope peptide [synthetic construct]3KPQ_C Chain C, EEYLKAWTF, mimotope peptide [synthetic construct]3KPR_C Chain C, EEYLKAWTF, mimotope peptide [synthetic construct]3KPR_H Chain H, EEYLKAWTF, mimotope peptide [synthetic construct]